MSATALAGAPVPQSPSVRVLIADDSVVVRGLVSKWLEEDGQQVVATAANGRLAVDALDRVQPDIVLLDIEMPELDGLKALPLLLAKRPGLQVVMMSTLTQRNAEVSLKALSLGAVDYLPKPESNRGVTTSSDFRADLLAKVKALGGPRAGRRTAQGDIAPAAARGPAIQLVRPAAALTTAPRPRTGHQPPRCLLVGASTGGPKAVGEVLEAIGAATLRRVPTLIVQHMPPVFTAVFAEHLATRTGLPAAEGKDGEPVMAGRIYVAPGGRHMGVAKGSDGAIVIRLTDGPVVNFCKPAVDVLFKDAAAIYGAATVTTVLTGMGSDGTEGARVLGAAGGTVVVQDEATSTVWGMPGSIARAGLAHEILPLSAIGGSLRGLIGGGP
jgi:two-component system, chemotaxis family, protein-glutamate methylesterase/glutaminase